MSAREWVVPFFLGLLTVGALWWVQPIGDDDGDRVVDDHGEGDPRIYVLEAETGGIAVGGPVLVIHRNGLPATANESEASRLFLEWQTTHVGYDHGHLSIFCVPEIRRTGQPTSPPCPKIGAQPVFAQNGTLSARITFYAFTEDGRLFATNAPHSDADRFRKHGDYTRFPASTVWYFGGGAAPEGTEKLPVLRSEAREILRGLPVGGVASASTSEYHWLLDSDLYLTARIEALYAGSPTAEP